MSAHILREQLIEELRELSDTDAHVHALVHHLHRLQHIHEVDGTMVKVIAQYIASMAQAIDALTKDNIALRSTTPIRYTLKGDNVPNPKFINVQEAAYIMVKDGYDHDQVTPFLRWHLDGRWVLIFENHDLGHQYCGHKFAMPWDNDELPPHGPDTSATGLGWRYLTTYAVRPKEGLDESETIG